MKSSGSVKRSVIILLFICLTIVLNAQDKKESNGFIPEVGQDGKDVIWVPTPDALVNRMLAIAGVSAKDILIDLGSGDGRTVIAAAKIGARSLGIEYNPDMVDLSKRNATEAGLSDKTKFMQADLFECDLSEATVITMFLLPEINLKLRPKLLELKPGTRIVSNTFTMGDWEPDYDVSTDEVSESWNTALLWFVPAKVEGIWKFPGGEFSFTQKFQMVSGTFKSGNKSSNVNDGRIKGDTITFSTDGAKYTGLVKGKSTMGGTATTNSAKWDWIATRTD